MTKSPYDNLPIGKDEITESNTGYMEVPLETLETSETSEASEKPSDDRKKATSSMRAATAKLYLHRIITILPAQKLRFLIK